MRIGDPGFLMKKQISRKKKKKKQQSGRSELVIAKYKIT